MMRTCWVLLLILAAAAPAAAAEVLDCVVATVGRQAITRSAVDEQARIAAFLNGDATPDVSPAGRRRTLERLIDVALIRREMEISRYAAPPGGARLPKQNQDPKALAALGLDEAAVKRHLELQAQTLRFVELRFRPGSSVTDGEMELYYREKYVPEWQRANPGKPTPPELDDVRDRIEAVLLEQRIDQAMEVWLKEARAQARLRYVAAEACAWD